jgi:hypothetical protein
LVDWGESASAARLRRQSASAGRPSRERRFTWLRSMRAEGRDEADQGVGIAALEGIIMITVWVAVIALLMWFFLLGRSPLPR